MPHPPVAAPAFDLSILQIRMEWGRKAGYCGEPEPHGLGYCGCPSTPNGHGRFGPRSHGQWCSTVYYAAVLGEEHAAEVGAPGPCALSFQVSLGDYPVGHRLAVSAGTLCFHASWPVVQERTEEAAREALTRREGCDWLGRHCWTQDSALDGIGVLNDAVARLGCAFPADAPDDPAVLDAMGYALRAAWPVWYIPAVACRVTRWHVCPTCGGAGVVE